MTGHRSQRKSRPATAKTLRHREYGAIIPG